MLCDKDTVLSNKIQSKIVFLIFKHKAI